VPRDDSGSAGEPEGQDRRAPGEAWSQLSEEVRDELTRPLRVESGHTSSPGVDPSRRQPDHRELRQGGPRLPELDEESAEGGGRAEYDRETAGAGAIRRPGRGGSTSRGREATRPNAAALSPGESGTGSPSAESTGSRRGDETAAGPQPKRARRGSRAPQSARDHRKASRREDRGEGGAPPEWG